MDMAEVKGQGHVKRAVEVAVTGNHNVLVVVDNHSRGLPTWGECGGCGSGRSWTLGARVPRRMG